MSLKTFSDTWCLCMKYFKRWIRENIGKMLRRCVLTNLSARRLHLPCSAVCRNSRDGITGVYTYLGDGRRKSLRVRRLESWNKQLDVSAALRNVTSRGYITWGLKVVCAILWNKCCYISLPNDPAYCFSKYGSPTKASFHNIPLGRVCFDHC